MFRVNLEGVRLLAPEFLFRLKIRRKQLYDSYVYCQSYFEKKNPEGE